MIVSAILWFVCVMVFGAIFTRFYIAYAVKNAIIDRPNERSSHSVPTPRGGGVSIVVISVIAAVTLGILYSFYGLVWWAAATSLVAAIGYIDDRYDLSARIRLSVHFIAAMLFVFGSGGIEQLSFGSEVLASQWLLNSLLVVALVWLLNLYNFMDGINGIAGFEALISLLLVACLLSLTGIAHSALFTFMMVMAGACAGFLVWNFPRAKVFMGDAGSGMLGFGLGGLAILSAQQNPEFLWSWLIMLGVFIVDATVTLLRRACSGQRLSQAHRTHAYQYLARRLKSHTAVTLAVLLVNVLWLAPFAYAVAYHWVSGIVGLLISYLPLVFCALYIGAGKAEVSD